MRDDGVYLRDILAAIENIYRYTHRGREVFEGDELVQVWIIHQIQIIGEATRKLSENLRFDHSEVPWPDIAAMRNVLVHDYFNIDMNEVWTTIENDIPDLQASIERILKELEG